MHGVCHFEIPTTDLEASKTHLGELFVPHDTLVPMVDLRIDGRLVRQVIAIVRPLAIAPRYFVMTLKEIKGREVLVELGKFFRV